MMGRRLSISSISRENLKEDRNSGCYFQDILPQHLIYVSRLDKQLFSEITEKNTLTCWKIRQIFIYFKL